MHFSIITPSFRNSKWLQLCIPSVVDQEGISLEHIVQDAGSDDGTLDWLLKDPRVRAYAEKDAGMYDAVNKGLRKSSGDIVAYINCDEQYLPGALLTVKKYFDAHPEVDVTFADMVVVDAQGQYICHRKVLLPMRYHSQVCTLPIYTCSMFIRRRVIDQHGILFDAKWRDYGDVAFVLALMDRKLKMGILRSFTSAFTDSGENMNLKPNARREQVLMRGLAPVWAQRSAPLLNLYHRARRLFHGIYSQQPFSYAIYTAASPDKRVVHFVDKPTFLWKTRIGLLTSRVGKQP